MIATSIRKAIDDARVTSCWILMTLTECRCWIVERFGTEQFSINVHWLDWKRHPGFFFFFFSLLFLGDLRFVLVYGSRPSLARITTSLQEIEREICGVIMHGEDVEISLLKSEKQTCLGRRVGAHYSHPPWSRPYLSSSFSTRLCFLRRIYGR
jgi:hypothetical protein